jgi:ribonuclease D
MFEGIMFLRMKEFRIVCILAIFLYCSMGVTAMNLYQDDLPANVVFKNSVAIDTETMGLNFKRDRLCLVQLSSENGEVHLLQIQKGQHSRSENLKKLLTDPSVVKIFHFARFDVSILNHTFGIRVNPIYCTKIASKLVRTYSDRHGLKDLCGELLNVDLSKQEQSSDWGKKELSSKQLEYAAGDVIYLHRLKSVLDQMLLRENRMPLAEEAFKAVQILADLQLADVNPDTLFLH